MKIIPLILFFALIFGCSSNTEDSLKPAKSGKYDEIIRNPVSANKPIDTINVSKFEFEEEVFNFGVVQEGKIVKHEYKFKNVGKVPLIVSNARSTCGCTVPKWPKDAIAPGDEGVLTVSFNTMKKIGKQRKPVIITSNTYPAKKKIYIEGEVLPNPAYHK